MVDYFEYQSSTHGTCYIRFIWHCFKGLAVREITQLNEQGLPVKKRVFYLSGKAIIFIPPHTTMRGETYSGIDNVLQFLRRWRSATTYEEIQQLIEDGLTSGQAIHKKHVTLSGKSIEERFFDFHVTLDTDLLRRPCWRFFRKRPGTELFVPTDENGNELFYPDQVLVNKSKWTFFKRSMLTSGPDLINVQGVS